MNIAQLFSTPIAVYDNVSTNPDLIATIASRDEQSADTLFHTKPAVQELTQAVEDYANMFSMYMYGRQASIRSSYPMIAGSGSYQPQVSKLSRSIDFCGVYYPQIDDNESIIFHSPFQNIYLINQKTTVKIEAKQNRLILFPPYVEHSFRSIKRDVERINLFFNFKLD